MSTNNNSPFELHLFVCTNTKENRKNCHDSGGADFHAKIKEYFRPLGKKIRINKSGCLGLCSQGSVAVLYPEGKWFKEMNEETVKEIIHYIEEKT